MLVKAADQTKREYCIAVANRHLHAISICPGNHDVDYGHGWFYFDGKPSQKPEWTAEAEQEMNNPQVCVGYSRGWNTYVLMDNWENDDDSD